MGRKREVILCLLDLSSAFDTLKHTILLQRLHDIGIKGSVLEWFRSYLKDRTTSIKVNNYVSPHPRDVVYGVPQGLVLGPALFNIYCIHLGNVIRKHNISYHMYVDDTQLYLDFRDRQENADIKTWLTDNLLLLNDKKTENVKFGKQHSNEDIQIGSTNIHTEPCVTSLGCTLVVELNMLNMSMHATRVCKSANYYLHCIRKIRNCLSLDICKLLVHTLVTVRLDYGNALLCGSRQFERVQRQAATVVCKKIKYDMHTSVTELLFGLHWLPISARIQYNVLLLVYKVFTTSKPPYLSAMLASKKQVRTIRSSLKVSIMYIARQFLTMVTLQRHFQ